MGVARKNAPGMAQATQTEPLGRTIQFALILARQLQPRLRLSAVQHKFDLGNFGLTRLGLANLIGRC